MNNKISQNIAIIYLVNLTFVQSVMNNIFWEIHDSDLGTQHLKENSAKNLQKPLNANFLYHEQLSPMMIPLESILKLHMDRDGNSSTIADTLYTDVQYTFLCSARQPLAGLKWQIKLKNETIVCIYPYYSEDTPLCDIYPEYPNYHGEFVTAIDQWRGESETYDEHYAKFIFHDPSVSGVICHVPIWDWFWISLTVNITVTASKRPEIQKDVANYEFDETGGEIKCEFTGYPFLTFILWHKDNQVVPPGVAISDDNTTLRFSSFNESLAGDYNCFVDNFKGHDTFTFRVTKKISFKDISLVRNLILSIIFTVAGLTILTLIFYYRYRSVKNAIIKLTKQEVDEFFNGTSISDCIDEDEKNCIFSIPYNVEYEIAREKMNIDTNQILGSGQFGQVFKGVVEGINEVVAFKTTKPDCKVEIFKALLLELKTMAFVGTHINIVRLIGACTSQIQDGILYIAMEFCELGSLEDFFVKNRSNYCQPIKENASYENIYNSRRFVFQFQNLVIWSKQIANGMDFLAEKKIIHSDLAIRNVLLDSKKTAKITDFGLSRRLYQYTNYVKIGEEPLPWRWMAVESIKFNNFSTKSDVWSFGITLWEIFSLGSLPYPGLSWSLEFGNQLEAGLRNAQPELATIEIYEIMTNCWQSNPDERPSFKELHGGLVELEKYYCDYEI